MCSKAAKFHICVHSNVYTTGLHRNLNQNSLQRIQDKVFTGLNSLRTLLVKATEFCLMIKFVGTQCMQQKCPVDPWDGTIYSTSKSIRFMASLNFVLCMKTNL